MGQQLKASEPCYCEVEAGPGSLDIFGDLPQEHVEALLGSVPMAQVAKGSELFGPHGPQALFLLKSGTVQVTRRSPDGKRLIVGIVEEGSFFGEMSLLGQRLEGVNAIAVEDCVVCTISRQDLEAMIQKHPDIALRMVEVLAQRLQQARDALQEMAFNDLTGRLAALLLRLAKDGDLVDGYSHQDLAAMLGCLQESLTATLDRFKRSEALSVGRRRIEITDRSQLERVVDFRSCPARRGADSDR